MRSKGTRVLMTADVVGGVWTYVLDLVPALQDRGFHVTVALMGPPMLESHRHDARVRGVDVVEEPFRLEWMDDPWADVDRAGVRLLDLAARCEADLVHLNGFVHAALPWHVPVVVVAHSCVRTWWWGVHGEAAPGSWNTYTARVTEGLRKASAVVAPTAALLTEVRSEYGVLGPSSVIPNGSVLASRPVPVEEKAPVVFSAGRLWDEAKNLEALCAVSAELSWPVYLAGDLEGGGRCFVPSGAVRHLGRLGRDEVYAWYGRAAIYALPARYEPFGLSIVEAAAHGCALVLGDIRSLRENWREAALFVPPDNRRALAAAIEQLIHDPPLRRELAERARRRSRAFTVARMADAYVNLYQRLLTAAYAA